TSTMADGALQVGTAFVDAQTGVTISAISKGAGGLTVSVARPPTRINTGLYRKLSTTGTPLYRFLLDYGFAQPPDAKIPFGMAGDVPLAGNFTSDGLTNPLISPTGR